MEYRYISRESHTNENDGDRSTVVLHDCMTGAMFRDGGEFVLPVPEGIIVCPGNECNPTDRYLQTGAAEIRLYNAECRTEFVPLEEVYEILHHTYTTVTWRSVSFPCKIT